MDLKREPYQHDTVRGIWITGTTGVGKSHRARTSYPNAYIKNQNKWWDGYKDHEDVIIEDFDKSGEGLGHHLKLWSDKWSCTGETKFGHI